MHGTTQSDSSHNEWQTPKGDIPLARSEITLNILKKKFNLQLDPCATKKIQCVKIIISLKNKMDFQKNGR